MIKLPKFKFGKQLALAKKIPWVLGEKVFLFLLALLLFSFLAGGLVFYKYDYLASRIESEQQESLFKFNQENYNRVLNSWDIRAKKFQDAGSEQYPNLFR